ncbi:hypothetical protein B566_EDAN010259 [Ephemera danica]|nr:hypothetical protein B566_EDAN010259 [Ephemera danica]
MNRKKAFEYCISLGMELIYIESSEEISCLKTYAKSTENEDKNDKEENDKEENDEEEEEEEEEEESEVLETNGDDESQLFEAWTSGISSENCPRSFRWCSGTSNLPVSQAVKSDSEEPPTKVLELCLMLVTSKVDKNEDIMKITLKSKNCSYRKVKSLCKKPFRKSPAPNMNFANKFQTSIRPAPTFEIKISGPINILLNFKNCMPVCAPLKPKDLSLFTLNGALKNPLNHGTLSTACNKDYMLSKNSMARSAALQFCGSLGMTLLVIDSVHDLDCLKNALPVLENTDVWVVAADISCSRRYQWCGSNIAVVDALWASDQPPYSDQHRYSYFGVFFVWYITQEEYTDFCQRKRTFWTSARDDGCPKKFNWCSDANISGKSVNESLWQSGAPDNFKGRERCAVMNFKTGLNDRNCDLGYSVACEVFHRTIKMFEITTPRPEICRPFETGCGEKVEEEEELEEKYKDKKDSSIENTISDNSIETLTYSRGLAAFEDDGINSNVICKPYCGARTYGQQLRTSRVLDVSSGAAVTWP